MNHQKLYMAINILCIIIKTMLSTKERQMNIQIADVSIQKYIGKKNQFVLSRHF